MCLFCLFQRTPRVMGRNGARLAGFLSSVGISRWSDQKASHFSCCRSRIHGPVTRLVQEGHVFVQEGHVLSITMGRDGRRGRLGSNGGIVPRYRLTIEYDGGPFVGWQRQENGPSVQQAVEEAVFRFCGERTTVHGAGRTDAGVHALGAGGACRSRPFSRAARRCATPQLPSQAGAGRRSGGGASGRRLPRPVLGPRTRLPLSHPQPAVAARLERGRVWWVPVPLDAERMADAAAMLWSAITTSPPSARPCARRTRP